ncbi:30S ribosomal protein S1, partial [Lactobacillus jensenii]|nr:30S ribosomal protein S1 [Lactobacillus jensenii]
AAEGEGNNARRSASRNDSVAKKYMSDNNDNGFALGDIIGDQLKDRQ